MDTAASAVPKERTLALVNTYVVHTAAMLNAFSASCEHSLSQVRSKHCPSVPSPDEPHAPNFQSRAVANLFANLSLTPT